MPFPHPPMGSECRPHPPPERSFGKKGISAFPGGERVRSGSYGTRVVNCNIFYKKHLTVLVYFAILKLNPSGFHLIETEDHPMKRKQINKHAKLTVLTSLLLILTLLISGCSDPSAMAGESVTTATEATTEAEPTTTAEPSPINQVLSDEMTAKIDSAYMETYNKSLQFEQTEQHACDR